MGVRVEGWGRDDVYVCLMVAGRFILRLHHGNAVGRVK
jgi:hypothetical protein